MARSWWMMTLFLGTDVLDVGKDQRPFDAIEVSEISGSEGRQGHRRRDKKEEERWEEEEDVCRRPPFKGLIPTTTTSTSGKIPPPR